MQALSAEENPLSEPSASEALYHLAFRNPHDGSVHVALTPHEENFHLLVSPYAALRDVMLRCLPQDQPEMLFMTALLRPRLLVFDRVRFGDLLRPEYPLRPFCLLNPTVKPTDQAHYQAQYVERPDLIDTDPAAFLAAVRELATRGAI